ncbi:MAG: anti-sigma factor antagonist [Acidobacteria bacterium]|nr:anti-sigma factor antagonist [Acidobacteriota bacterium]
MESHYRSARVKKRGIARQLELVLQSQLESADLAEMLLAQFSDQAGCNEQQLNEIALAVREGVVNAVIHGNRNQTRKKVYVHAELRRAGVEICIRDEGKGFDPRSVPDPRRPENLLRESGRGILMMHALMDRVSIRRAASNGMEVRMVKLLSQSSEEEHKMSLKVTTRQADGVTILDLSGRIILGEPTATLRDTFQELITRGQKKVLLNLADVNYIDSSGLGALVSGFTTLTNQQGQLKLLNLAKKVHDLLQITKLLTVFEVYEDEIAALKSFR